MKLEEAVHMFYYDSVHGKFKGTVEAKDGKLIINGHAITMFAEKVCVFEREREKRAHAHLLRSPFLRTLAPSPGPLPAQTTSWSRLVSSPTQTRPSCISRWALRS